MTNRLSASIPSLPRRWRQRSLLTLFTLLSGCGAHPGDEPGSEALENDGQLGSSEQALVVQSIITDAKLDKTSLCPGDSVKVTVTAATNATVLINGVPSRERVLQFAGVPGKRLISVGATTPNGMTDWRDLEVQVVGCTTTLERPDVFAGISQSSPSNVNLRVANADDLDATSYEWEFGDGTRAVTSVPATSHDYKIDHKLPDSTYEVKVTAVSSRGRSVGRRSVVIHSMYAHNRARGLLQPPTVVVGHSAPQGSLTLRALNPETETLNITREEVRWLPCGAGEPTLGRASNVNVPIAGGQTLARTVSLPAEPNSACGVAVHMTGRGATSGMPVAFTVYDETKRKIFHPLSDATTKKLLRQAVQAGLVTDNTRSVSVDTLQRWVREERIGQPPRFTVDPSRFQLTDGIAGQLQPPSSTNPLLAGASSSLVSTPLASSALLTPPAARILPAPAPAPAPAPVGGLFDFDIPDLLDPPELFVRTPCDPDAAGAPPQPGYTCQPGELDGDWEEEDSYILNAFKGDVVLSSQCSDIGSMLRALEPRQVFSHTGIMVRNQDRIRHSTSVKGWYMANDRGILDEPTNGFSEWALRYGFPGVITSTVSEAFNFKKKNVSINRPQPAPQAGGTPRPDAVYSFNVAGFHDDLTLCPGDEGLVFPTVVTTPAGVSRASLVAIADAALQLDGHYRFYGYSNGAIALDPAYTQTKPWPEMTNQSIDKRATVCSTFVWAAAKKAGITLEGALENGEWPYAPDAETKDGLYFYPESVRKLGAKALRSNLYNEALKKAGRFGDFLTDAAADVSNQMVNCFAADYCSRDAKDSEAWREPGEGRTVSPDNILLWDTYGHNEPVAMRKGAYRRKYYWAPAVGSGSLDVTVELDDKPVKNARVTFDGGFSGVTNSQGKVSFTPVPGGQQEIRAQIWSDGEDTHASCAPGSCELLAKSAIATIRADRATAITLDLPKPKNARSISVNGELDIRDFDSGRDEFGNIQVNHTFRLSLGKKKDSFTKKKCVDGEVESTLKVEATLLDDLSADVTVTIEQRQGWGTAGNGCQHLGGAHVRTDEVTVPMGGSREVDATYSNSESRTYFRGQVSNVRTP